MSTELITLELAHYWAQGVWFRIVVPYHVYALMALAMIHVANDNSTPLLSLDQEVFCFF